MNLGFKPQFVTPVMEGKKRHTIRRGQRWRVGMRGDLWKNMRGPKVSDRPQTLLFRAPIIKVEDITIVVFQISMLIYINGVEISNDEQSSFAKRDGFPKGRDQMHAFWMKEHGPRRGLTPTSSFTFEGQVIHWDYKRRVFV